VILGIVQSLFLLYIDDSNNLISIICNSNPNSSTTNSSQNEGIILNEETNNNTANVNIKTVSISNVNVPASVINTANAVGNGAIVAASIKAAAKVSQSNTLYWR
jgi:BRCT domain type II-containing protein